MPLLPYISYQYMLKIILAGTDPEIYQARWVAGLGFKLALSYPYHKADSVELTCIVCVPHLVCSC